MVDKSNSTSSDAVIIDKSFTYPDSILKQIDPNNAEILLQGDNPYSHEGLLSVFDSTKPYKIVGHFLRVDSVNGKAIPVFFVV